MSKTVLLLLVALSFISCRNHLYTVKLDSQLYSIPNSDGQKLKALIYYKKWNPIFSFDSESIIEEEIPAAVKAQGGNRVVPIAYKNRFKSITDETKYLSREVYLKGYIIHEITE